MTTVAFIGLGNMGRFMAANLVRKGFDVCGFDPVETARDTSASDGVRVVASAADAVREAGVIVTSLPNGSIVRSVYDEVLPAAAPGSLFIDCSTVDVQDARDNRDLAVAAGHRAVDSPMSGGTTGAEQGTLTFMVGGDAADLEAARPVLEGMGRTVVHCGGSGAGQAVKMCNNMVLAVSMIAVSEAFVLAESLGVEDQAFFNVASNATASCWALNTNCPVAGPVPTSPANRDFTPGFMSSLMAKDLGIAANAIAQTGVETRMGSLAVEIYRAFAAGDGGRQDFSAIINEIREHSGKETT